MGNFLKIIQLALGIVPMVIELVKAIELPGNGLAKKDAVLQIVTAAITTFSPEMGVKVETIGRFVSQTIDIVVTLLNAAGVFKPKPVPVEA
jgi:hypothetical protein